MTRPVYTKTPESRMAGAERKIRFLERRSQTPEPDIYGAAAGGGIQFDTSPQDGNWLYVETTDAAGAGGAPNDYGIELKSADDMALEAGGTLGLYGDQADLHFSGAAPAWRLRTDSRMEFVNTLPASTIEFTAAGFVVNTSSFSAGNHVLMTSDDIHLLTTGGHAVVIDAGTSLQATATDDITLSAVDVVALQGGRVEFHSATQQGTLSDLASVIALLQSYGLAS